VGPRPEGPAQSATHRFSDPHHTAFYHALPFLTHVCCKFSSIGKDQSVGDPDRLREALGEGTTVIAGHACSYDIMFYEKLLPTFQDLAKRYPHFYANISTLTLPNRMRMLLHLRRYPEIHERLLFGTDYPLPVFHIAAWGRVAFGTLRKMIRTKNRFDRKVAVCHGLKFDFRSLGDPLLQPTAKTMPWPAQIMVVRGEMSGKPNEGRVGRGEGKT
jgi:hypothetical protein